MKEETAQEAYQINNISQRYPQSAAENNPA